MISHRQIYQRIDEKEQMPKFTAVDSYNFSSFIQFVLPEKNGNFQINHYIKKNIKLNQNQEKYIILFYGHSVYVYEL